jgi:hypothetical protein
MSSTNLVRLIYCVTANVAVPDTLPEVAVILTLTGKEGNGPRICACPLVGLELLIVTFELSVDQTTASVTSALPPPANVPVAENGIVCPVSALTDEGDT